MTNAAKLLAPVLLGAALGLSSSQPAFAGGCNVFARSAPLLKEDSLKITCSKNGGPVSVGRVGVIGQRFVFADLLVNGGPGTMATASAIGEDGRVIAGCVHQDFTADGAGAGARCDTRFFRWLGQVFHIE